MASDEYATVDEHVTAGRIVARKRVRADDLLMAATWLEAYEGAADDVTLQELATAAAYLRREAAKRK